MLSGGKIRPVNELVDNLIKVIDNGQNASATLL